MFGLGIQTNAAIITLIRHIVKRRPLLFDVMLDDLFDFCQYSRLRKGSTREILNLVDKSIRGANNADSGSYNHIHIRLKRSLLQLRALLSSWRHLNPANPDLISEST